MATMAILGLRTPSGKGVNLLWLHICVSVAVKTVLTVSPSSRLNFNNFDGVGQGRFVHCGT